MYNSLVFGSSAPPRPDNDTVYMSGDSSLEKVAIYSCPNFNVTRRQSASAIPFLDGSTNLPRIPSPLGLNFDLFMAAAWSVAQLHGSDSINLLVLSSPTHQQLWPPEIALFANHNDSQHVHIDENDNLIV